MNRTVYILEMDKAKAELLQRGADEIGSFAKGALGRIDSLEEFCEEAIHYIRDLLILLSLPQDATEFIHGQIPLNREDSISYTVHGALEFVDRLDAALRPFRSEQSEQKEESRMK